MVLDAGLRRPRQGTLALPPATSARVSSFVAILGLIRARMLARPGRAAFIVVGLAIATAFTGSVAAEGTIAGDRAARSVLARLSPLERAIRLTTSDIVDPSTERHARGLLHSLQLRAPTEVVLLDPVRLSGVIGRPAAVERLGAWITTAPPRGACRASRCPVLVTGAALARMTLTAHGVRLTVHGRTRLRSAAP